MLVKTGKYEEGALAILFAAQLRDQYTPATLERIARWFDGGFRNWAHTDVLCGEVLSHFLTAGVVPLKSLRTWRESPHKFQRRAVPVAIIPLLKQTTDYKPLLDLIRPLMHDPERVVQQGLGWFLREAWKRQPGVIEPFLLEHKDTSPRLIFQYATEKMTPQAKKRFRKG
jgi:3-methyladenine DNA glycosylase AlkD